MKLTDKKIIEDYWREGIRAWKEEGDPSILLHYLRKESHVEVPGFAREFLAGLLTGETKRPRKRPNTSQIRPLSEVATESLVRMEYTSAYCRRAALKKIERALGEALRGESPKELALKDVAEHLRMKPGTVSHIVHPRRGKKV